MDVRLFVLMDYHSPCRQYSRDRLEPVKAFLQADPRLLSSMNAAGLHAFIEIAAAIAHLRSKKARDFFREVSGKVLAFQEHPYRDLIFKGSTLLSAHNWALVLPFFQALHSLPEDEDFIRRWTFFAYYLATQDIDAAIAFLTETPQAAKVLGYGRLSPWGRQALEGLGYGKIMWRAVKAYLEESAADRCATPLDRWRFLLQEAVRLARVSVGASEAFIRHGSRFCLLLEEQEIREWVTEGLAASVGEEDLIQYFRGISLRALEKRDGLAAGATLKERANTLALICEALLGKTVPIRSNTNLIGVQGFGGGPATDGRTIFLPDRAPDFGWYKLMALHQALLIGEAVRTVGTVGLPEQTCRLHRSADTRLLDKLPGLKVEMERLAPAEDTPSGEGQTPSKPKPWWGDLLPELVQKTEATIQHLRDQALSEYDVPPEVIEALLASLMSEGRRDPGELWGMLQELFDHLELTAPGPEELQENVKTFSYKEWDQDLHDYKLEWCLVRQRWAKDDPNPFAEEVRDRLQGLITLIRRLFIRLKPERFKKFRAQPYGDDLDLDALVQALVDQRCGSFLSDNVYIRRDKRVRDVAVLFLLDLSGSTDERVEGRRVIDIQKEAMVLMAEALEALGDPFAILGFSTDGRFRNDLFLVKDFGETYGERVRHRLGNLEPLNQTRLGAVLRHGLYKLEGVSALIRLMIVLTDGRPYDVDYGNLDYAIADTKKAMQEVRSRGIHPFLITSDKKGAGYLKEISPQTQSIILPRVESLPVLLPALYKRLTA
ncbi:MAG: VWA domain-containing protein [Deltaproteobacteria bacterium]|nr:VWA domain-containing protein [Deltaproteobacteria bacterium]